MVSASSTADRNKAFAAQAAKVAPLLYVHIVKADRGFTVFWVCRLLSIPFLMILAPFAVGCQPAENSDRKKTVSALDDYRSRVISLPPVFVEEVPYLSINVPIENPTSEEVKFTKLIKSCSCSEVSVPRMTL